MLSKLYARKNRENGFTLIELLIVVIIIGVLAAIALPIFIDQSKQAVDASVKSDVRNTVTNVNEWRATNDAALPTSAEDYATKGGVLATSKGTYINVAFTSDNDYVVCGYNPGGKNYADYQHAWAFTASTGKFTSLADINGKCDDAVHVRATPTDDSGDNAGDGSGSAGSGRVVTVTRTTDGSSTYLAYDPHGETGNPAGGGNPTTDPPPTDPTGGTDTPTTGDPGSSNRITAASIYPLGDGGDGGDREGFQYNRGKPCCTWDVSPYIFGGSIYGEQVPATGTYDSPDLNALDGLTANTPFQTQTVSASNYDIYYGTRNYSTGKISGLEKVAMNSKSACTFTYGTSGSYVNATVACPFDPNTTNGSDAANAFASDKRGEGSPLYGLVVKFKATDLGGALKDNTLQLTPQIEID